MAQPAAGPGAATRRPSSPRPSSSARTKRLAAGGLCCQQLIHERHLLAAEAGKKSMCDCNGCSRCIMSGPPSLPPPPRVALGLNPQAHSRVLGGSSCACGEVWQVARARSWRRQAAGAASLGAEVRASRASMLAAQKTRSGTAEAIGDSGGSGRLGNCAPQCCCCAIAQRAAANAASLATRRRSACRIC